MTRLVARWFCWGLLLGVLGTMSGCGGVVQVPLPDLEGVTGSEESPSGHEEPSTNCASNADCDDDNACTQDTSPPPPPMPGGDLLPEPDSSSPPEDQFPPLATWYSRYELPAGTDAWVLQADPSTLLGVDPPTATYVREWLDLDGEGYDVKPSGSSKADLATLRSVQNAAVLFIDSHGGYSPRLDTYGVMTADRVEYDSSQLILYDSPLTREDHEEGRIYPMKCNGCSDIYWAITHLFVDTYMTFAEDALVYISACSSQGLGQDFRQACWAKGAGTYIGWTNRPTGADTDAAAKFFFDRMLGTNARIQLTYAGQEWPLLPVMDPPLRPFGLLNTLGAMIGHQKPWDGWSYDVSWRPGLDQLMPARLWASGRNGSVPPTSVGVLGDHTTGALRPPVYRLKIDEAAGQLIIHGESSGSLGTRLGRVSVGGKDLFVVDWTPEEIVCDVPRDAAGEVEVSVNDIPSNTRWISVWKDVEIQQTSYGGGTYFVSTTWSFPEIRADIMNARRHAGSDPANWTTFYVVPTQNARFSWDAGGTSSSLDGRVTTVWTKGPDPDPVYVTEGYTDWGEFSCRVSISASEFVFNCDAMVREGIHGTSTNWWGGTSEFNEMLAASTSDLRCPAENFVLDAGWCTNSEGTFVAELSVGSTDYLPEPDAPR